MINIIAYEKLGYANYGWLEARHHFNFGQYYDPARKNFGTLLVINDDRISANKGFPPHPHDNMEIITYVRKGAIVHKDNFGNTGRTEAGDVQVMSAGTGIIHSEYNLETEDTVLYQIWILPNQNNVSPRWENKKFPKNFADKLPLLVSGNINDQQEGAIFIHQEAKIYGGVIKKDYKLQHEINHQAYILASRGSFLLNQNLIKQGDGVEVLDEKLITIEALEDSEILIIDVAE